MKTVLCVPGHDEKKVEKCREYGADLILFDLEDSVPENMKDRAREIVAAHAQPEDHVRVNGWAVGARSVGDIDTMFGKCRSLWIPKALHVTDVIRQGVLIVETPELLHRMSRLVDIDPFHRPAGLAFGAADFASYMNVPPASPVVEYARMQVALTAAALGIPAYDSPCTNVGMRMDHPDSVYNEAYRARKLGYQWKGVVHPSQIDEVRLAGMSLSEDRQLVDLYDAQSEAVMLTDRGKLIAPPMIRAARRRIEEASK
jgi:citrate lyase beta subunit